MEKRLYTVNEVADMFGLSARSLRNKIAPKASHPFPIRPIRVGGAVRFDIKDIEAYLQAQKNAEGINGGISSMPDLPGEAVA